MKKTVTANISGIVFHIDEDAYEKLGRYLSKVKSHFNAEAGSDEILADIESRIAEMFQEKITASKKVISIEDVNEVISQLGEPEQMAEPEEEPKSKGPKFEERAQKRLYRDPDDKYIAGVSGGLGAFFNLDPVWIRVAFVVFTFVYGFGPLLYIILWIVVPKAKTTAERLEMRGEKVNLSNIEKSIKEELNELKDNIKEFSEETKQHFKKKEKSRADRDRSAQLAAGLMQVFVKAAGIILIFLAFSFLVALVSAIFFFPFGLEITHGIFGSSLPEIFSAFLTSTQWVNLALISIVLIVGIPVFWMLMTGIQLLFDIKTTSKYLGLITFIIWLAAVAVLSISAVNGARNFTSHHETSSEYVFERSDWPNLYVQLNESGVPRELIRRNRFQTSRWSYLWKESSEEALGIPELRLKTSRNDNITLEVIKESRGPSIRQAALNAENINYTFSQRDSLLLLDPVFYFDKSAGWRNQKVKLELSIPEDKAAMLQKDFRRKMWVQWSRSVNVVEQ
jgi:phage shock protein PspC (stress-responsive transcriptional regulator)